jgi:hypothetical protein
MGACFPGERAVFRGHDLHRELKDLDWIELYVFGITGRRFTPEQLRLLHAMWVNTSYPDARIWNNRIAALAGSTRSTPALAIAAALAATEATIYGLPPCVKAIDFIVRAEQRVAAGESLEVVVREELLARRIYGYGRPITSADERLPWLRDIASDLNLHQGPHLRLAFALERILEAEHSVLRMNYSGMAAALAADMGFSPAEFHLFTFPMALAGMPPCFIESAHQPEGMLFPLSCAHIRYEGAPKRSWHER